MKQTLSLSLALSCSWLFCPEALTIVGNTAGQMGYQTLVGLLVAAFIFSACGILLTNHQLPDSPEKELLILRPLFGTMVTITLTLAACIPLTVLAGTALLVTAGYTFNEVFLYWFPNFGFAFLLLSLITILQFFRDRVILWGQVCFAALAAGGLLLLAVYAMIHPQEALPAATAITEQSGGFAVLAAPLLLLLFVGTNLSHSAKSSFAPLLVPVIALLIFSFWIVASLNYVTPERLASSTIPYMTTARKIMGDPGRWIMGVVVISGTCGAVNGLMMLSRRMLTSLANQKMAPAILSGNKQKWIIPPGIALLTGGLMATGLAGDELLEVLLLGALILWLVYYVFLCFSAIVWLKREKQTWQYPAIVASLMLAAGIVIVIIGNPHKGELFISILSGLGASGLITVCWLIIKTLFNRSIPPTSKEK